MLLLSREDGIAVRLTVLAGALLIGKAAIVYATKPEVRPTAPLSALSAEIGPWRGYDAERFTPAVERILGADAYLNRIYAADAGAPVSLYVGYYASQQQGDTIHSPMNCLPGAGWQPTSNRRISVDVAAPERTVRVNEYVVQKGAERQVVLYWYQSHGRVVADEYVSRALMVFDAIRLNRSDAALVRVNTPAFDADDLPNAARRAAAFVSAVFPRLAALLPA